MESPSGKSELMTGKVVVITGGASGIGRATALAFAREGAGVVIGDIDIAGAENTVATIRDMGRKADCLRVDVAKSDDVQALVIRAVGQYGGLDFAFNNAGLVGSVAARRDDRRGLQPRGGNEPDGRLALHEIRDSRDVEARTRRHRE